MSGSRHRTMSVIGGALLVALGWLLFVWPVYRAAAADRTQLKKARIECERGSAQPQRAYELDLKLAELQQKRRERRQKEIPPAGPDEEMLIRTLFARSDDRHNPLQINYAFGKATEAVPGWTLPHQAMPLTVKLKGTWRSIFDLVQRAESVDRLLRVSAVEIRCDHADDDEEGLASADIVLDVIYKQDVVKQGGGR